MNSARRPRARGAHLDRPVGPTGHRGGYSVPARLPGSEGNSMTIGLGTLVVILVIVLIIYFIRRA
jgi:hypothetical protein